MRGKAVLLTLAPMIALFVWSCSEQTKSPLAPVGDTPVGGTVDRTDQGSTGGTDATKETDVPGGTETGSAYAYFPGSIDPDIFPMRLIVSGGPPKDGIPALTNPEFVTSSEASYLRENDLVLGVSINGVAKAYPENMGWWHEIINDQVGDQAISMTFCPLTGTGLNFGAESGDGQFELGVSGLLYNSNLVMYDRRDDETLYPQMYFTAVNGTYKGDVLRLLPVVETTWATWKRLYPETLVISDDTGYGRDYTRYPYGGYRQDHFSLLFPLTPSPRQNPALSQLELKDKVLGVRLNDHPKAYPFNNMGDRAVINDHVGGTDLVVVWYEEGQLAIPYDRQVGDRTLSFDIETSTGGFPFNMRDRETGSLWNIKGEAIEGELKGKRLNQIPAHTAFWFAWGTFWMETEVWP